tara:strand:- start:14116 stop:14385 length:270 start_codon:yes stop_codon:yes gene_type:complete
MNDKVLTKFILQYLTEKPDYLKLSAKQQRIAYQTYKTIMMAIYQSIKHDNIFPIIVCGDAQAKKVIDKSLKSVQPILPSIEKITVHLVQ